MPDNPLLRHFWLLVLVVMFVNVAIWRRRLEEFVAAGRASRDEAARFLRGVVIAAVVITLVGEAVSLAAGWPNVLCVYGEPWTAPAALVMWGITAATWVLALWWVWRGRGAEMLARLAPALGGRAVRERTYTPRQVRLVVTGVVALSAVGTIVNRAVSPTTVPRCTATSGLTKR